MDVIALRQAENIASHYLCDLGREIGVPLAVVKRRELPYEWLFFYNSSAYLKSGEVGTMLAGNAPFIVDVLGGSVHVLGTAHPVEIYLKEYEAARGQLNQ
ncbi:YrhB domain-containing protein [Ralstonia nicotianae]